MLIIVTHMRPNVKNLNPHAYILAAGQNKSHDSHEKTKSGVKSGYIVFLVIEAFNLIGK
jgi:hypothetical protein